MEKSNRQYKKFKITTPKGKVIHFGDNRYEDYTQHHDKKRMLSYCKRSIGIRNKKGERTAFDPETANYYSTRILWMCNLLKWWK